MNKEKISIKDKIYEECRIEDVTNDTFCLWHEVVLGMPPMCFLEAGEWCWSKDFKKLIRCFKESIAWNYACAVAKNADYAIEENSTVFILEKYSDDFSTSINESNLCKELIELLKKDFDDPVLANDYLNKVFECFNKLGVETSYSFCKGADECMDVVIKHYGGVIPVYPTVKQYLLEDYLA